MTADEKLFEPLAREEVIKAVTRGRPSRIPLIMAKWWGEGLEAQYGDRLSRFQKYPEDAVMLWHREFLSPASLKLPWWKEDLTKANDNQPVLDSWDRLEDFIARIPDPEKDPVMDRLAVEAEEARKNDRYVLFAFWRLFFERPWQFRGMENLMMDYFLEPDKVHRLHGAFCDTYLKYLRRAVRDIRPDGFFSSDDLGNQRQPMMSPAMFDGFLKPYYLKIGAFLRENKVHWWLHSCGNNTPLLPALVEAGLTVFHPVQKGTMEERAVADQFGGSLSFLAGMDVQHTLREKDPKGVRREVRFLIDTFDQQGGGLCLAAGNGIVAGTPIENIEAFLDEAVRYGAAHRARFN